MNFMDIAPYDIKVPLKRFLLTFINQLGLESNYQSKTRKNVYSQLRCIVAVGTITMILLWALCFAILYINHDIYRTNSVSNKRKIEWGCYYMPITILAVNIDIIFNRFLCYSKLRGTIFIIVVLYQMGDTTVYIYEGEEAFSTYSLAGAVALTWYAERVVYNWLSFCISSLLGLLAMGIRMSIFGGVEISYTSIVGIFFMMVILNMFGRSSEEMRRREFYIIGCVWEKEKEWKRLLSCLPVGIIIQEEPQSSHRETLLSLSSNIHNRKKTVPHITQTVKYFNHSISQILNINCQGGDHNNRSILFSNRSLIEEGEVDRDKDGEYYEREAIYKFMEDILSKYIDTNNPIEMIYQLDGQKLDLKLEQIRVTFENERCIGIIIQDVTLIKKMQREKLMREYQSRLVATITHEIRTPLNAIKGSAEILDAGCSLHSNHKIYINTIQNSIKLLLGFVDCMLNLSLYSQKGLIILHPHNFNIRNVLGELISIFQFEVELKGIKMELIIDDLVPLFILLDSTAISQIIFVLLGNSLKYTFHGVITLSIQFNSTNSLLYILVTDTGLGIHEDHQKSLFGLFGSDSEAVGAGVGLTLCKALTMSLQGKIKLTSKLGSGTSVRIEIPCSVCRDRISSRSEGSKYSSSTVGISIMEEGNKFNCGPYQERELRPHFLSKINKRYVNITEEEGEEMKEIVPIIMSSVGGRDELDCNCSQILIVDDIQVNIFILKGLLGLLDLTADEASNGLIALQMYNESYMKRSCCLNYMLIMMDCNMPIMDGYETTRQIRHIESERGGQPSIIIAITAYDSEENRTLCYEAGMNYVIPKPVSRNDLKKAFNHFHIFSRNLP